jgi:hypothetical protein
MFGLAAIVYHFVICDPSHIRRWSLGSAIGARPNRYLSSSSPNPNPQRELTSERSAGHLDQHLNRERISP